MQADLVFSSRRSPVVCLNGCVASSQPLASNIGLEILKKGGNAADAAVAVAAALNVTEPTSTGLGGDAFCLFYDAATKQVRGLNGSGRSPKAQNLELMERCGFSQSNPPPNCHAINVTVPGAAACWCDTVTLFGSKKVTLSDLLQPAIELAQKGFPVAEITAYQWAKNTKSLRVAGRELGADLLINNQPPKHGQVMTNPKLAHTFQELVLHGKTGFYEGRIAQAVVEVVQENGGVMSLDDMKNHVTTEITPINIDYKTVRVWEVPPNSQGMAALIALNILENIPLKDLGHNSANYLHILVESLKLSMADTMHFSTDPDKVNVPVEGLLSKDYALQRAQLIQMDRPSLIAADKNEEEDKADSEEACHLRGPRISTKKMQENVPESPSAHHQSDTRHLQELQTLDKLVGHPPQENTDIAARSVCEPGTPTGSDTVYFSVVDGEGNACSFVNSNYMGFGTGLVPRNCGFSLQNRGANFSLDPTHVNCVGPEKRPYHTIIPAMVTDPLSGCLLCSFGVMGGFMQPQGHVQVLLNMLEFGMDPQLALDAPRVFVQYDQAAQMWQLNLEAGMDRGVVDELRKRGHVVNWPVEGHGRERFGRGQIISVGKWWWDLTDEKPEGEERVLWAGSDPRADGCALGY